MHIFLAVTLQHGVCGFDGYKMEDLPVKNRVDLKEDMQIPGLPLHSQIQSVVLLKFFLESHCR